MDLNAIPHDDEEDDSCAVSSLSIKTASSTGFAVVAGGVVKTKSCLLTVSLTNTPPSIHGQDERLSRGC